MSTLEPSASARPLVTSGMAVMPPLPVLVPTPAPVRWNQVSSVNVAAPSPGAAPNVTYWLLPLKARAVPAGAAETTGTNGDGGTASSIETSRTSERARRRKTGDEGTGTFLTALRPFVVTRQ